LVQITLDERKTSVIVAYNTEHPKQDITMTRKLHNTLMAAITSSGLLVVGLIASTPVAPQLDAATVVIASIDRQTANASDAFANIESPLQQRSRPVRPSRQTLAMPFFSVAPRS
jgi:hypothetical protein